MFPQRPISHAVGDRAVGIFVACCDPSWVITPVSKDYGLDLRIEVTRGEYVTGEEFGVQIKGTSSLSIATGFLPQVQVRQSTINYWLGKLPPTMVAVVDVVAETIFYDWLEHCYPPYPETVPASGEVALSLRHSAGQHDLKREVRNYVGRYYASMSRDMERLSKGIYLANLLFSISALHRLSAHAVIELQGIEPSNSGELKDRLHNFCFAFASHDNLMEGLRGGAFGHRPKSNSRFFRLVDQKLRRYDEVKSKFLIYRGETATGDLIVEPKYAELYEWLLPMVHVLGDIEEALGLAQVTNRTLIKNAPRSEKGA